jgi:hypothetical protein
VVQYVNNPDDSVKVIHVDEGGNVVKWRKVEGSSYVLSGPGHFAQVEASDFNDYRSS